MDETLNMKRRTAEQFLQRSQTQACRYSCLAPPPHLFPTAFCVTLHWRSCEVVQEPLVMCCVRKSGETEA